MASDQVKERIEVAKAESARLERRLRELSDDDLRRPSACDHWEVADVVAHLAFAAQFQARMITRGLEGDDSIPEGARRQESEGTPASERIAHGALALRERLGDGLLDTFHQRYQELGQLLDAIGPDDYDKPCWHPWGDTNVSDFVDLAINELAIHGWDVCSSLDPGYHIEQATLPAALAVSSNVLVRVVQTGLGPVSVRANRCRRRAGPGCWRGKCRSAYTQRNVALRWRDVSSHCLRAFEHGGGSVFRPAKCVWRYHPS